MKIPTDKEIKAVKEAYKKGMRVQLVRMDDEYGQAQKEPSISLTA